MANRGTRIHLGPRAIIHTPVALLRQGICGQHPQLWGGGGFGTRPWWLALLACGGAYWPLAFEPSAMTSRHPYYWGGGGCKLKMQKKCN